MRFDAFEANRRTQRRCVVVCRCLLIGGLLPPLMDLIVQYMDDDHGFELTASPRVHEEGTTKSRLNFELTDCPLADRMAKGSRDSR